MLARTSTTALALCLVATLVTSQITFSRDWTGGGKRSAPALPVDCAQFAKLCRHVVQELKQSMRANHVTNKKRLDDEAYIYNDE